MNRAALLNIALIARSGYDPKTFDSNEATYHAIDQIAELNYQKVHDNEINLHLASIHYAAPVRLHMIAERATEVLRQTKRRPYAFEEEKPC